MNRTYVSKAIMRSAIVLYLLHKLLPIIGVYMPTMVYFALFLVTALTTLYAALNSKVSYEVMVSLLLFIPSVFDMFYFMLHSPTVDTAKFLYGEAQIYIQIVIALVYIKLMSTREQKKLLYITLTAYFLTALSTGIACTFTPNAARIITGSSNIAIYQQYRKQNVGDFVFAYEFILLTPLLICCIKNKKMNRLGGIALLLFCSWVVLEMQFTLGLILFAVFVFTLLLPRLKRQHILLLSLLAICILLFARPLLADFFDHLGKSVDNLSFSSRFEYIATILRGDKITKTLESKAGSRFDLYMLSLQEFLRNPLGHWGAGTEGGHSYILDRAARYGVPGLLSIAIMYIAMYRFFIQPYRKSSCYAYLLLGFLLSIVLAAINTKTFMFIFVFVYPLFAQVYSAQENHARSLSSFK